MVMRSRLTSLVVLLASMGAMACSDNAGEPSRQPLRPGVTAACAELCDRGLVRCAPDLCSLTQRSECNVSFPCTLADPGAATTACAEVCEASFGDLGEEDRQFLACVLDCTASAAACESPDLDRIALGCHVACQPGGPDASSALTDWQTRFLASAVDPRLGCTNGSNLVHNSCSYSEMTATEAGGASQCFASCCVTEPCTPEVGARCDGVAGADSIACKCLTGKNAGKTFDQPACGPESLIPRLWDTCNL